MTALLLLLFTGLQPAPPSPDALFEAARAGDTRKVVQLLDAGLDVNSKARYDATALMFAADKGHLDLVRLLLDRGAAIDATDTFYRFRAINMALMNGHLAVARLLLERGSPGAGQALTIAIWEGDEALARAALASKGLEAAELESAAAVAARTKGNAVADLVARAAAERPAAAPPEVSVPLETLKTFAGVYRNDDGVSATVSIADGRLALAIEGQPPLALTATSQNTFAAPAITGANASFAGRGGIIESLAIEQSGKRLVLARMGTEAAPASAAPAAVPAPPAGSVPVTRTAAKPWPSFRGPDASGVADGQGAVAEWDVASGRNVRWKTPVPGIAVSSPVIWGDRVFVTTATGGADQTFRTGLYGDVKPVDDLSPHTWKVLALDRRTGAIAWEREVFSGAPKVKRHTTSSQASSTPATDGKHVVVVFGTVGLLAAYNVDGTELWRRDIGVIDNGWFFDPTYQWGHSSSPILHGSSVILQVDQQKGSYIAAFDLATGKPRWRTERPAEISTWGTPTLVRAKNGVELVTNGTTIRGYDPDTGKELWALGPNSEITVGTPIASGDLIYVTGGYPPVRPVYAVRTGASGDLTLPKGETTSSAIAWSNDRDGTYIPTPLVYRGQLYTLNSNGILTAYTASTGERLYRARVGGGGAFSASPIAADGRLYLASEDGEIFVVEAGPAYRELGRYPMGEVIMSTPAISDGVLVVRTLGHVYGIGAVGQ